MTMPDLVQLVKSYVNGEMNYAAFRSDFVTKFLAVRNEDIAVDGAVVLIESLCVDAAEGEIGSHADFLERLRAIANPTEAATEGPNPVQILTVAGGNGYRGISSGSTSVGANSLQAVA